MLAILFAGRHCGGGLLSPMNSSCAVSTSCAVPRSQGVYENVRVLKETTSSVLDEMPSWNWNYTQLLLMTNRCCMNSLATLVASTS